MVANRKVTGIAMSMPGGLALGGVVSLLTTILGTGVFAYMLSTETVSADAVGYCAMGILLASSMLGSMTAAGKIKHRKIYVCGLTGLIYYLTLLAITALFFGGQYQGIGVTALVILAGSGTAALLGTKGKNRRHSSKRKIRHG